MLVQKLKEMDHTLGAVQRRVAALQAHQASMESRLVNSRSALMAATATYLGRSYFLSRPLRRNMAVADTLCRFYGGYLLEVDDKEEFEFVTNFVQKKLKTATAEVNVGLGSGDEGHEGTWKFRYSSVDARFLSWAVGEPNGSTEENCIFLSGMRSAMYDQPCQGTDLVRFVCEVPF